MKTKEELKNIATEIKSILEITNILIHEGNSPKEIKAYFKEHQEEVVGPEEWRFDEMIDGIWKIRKYLPKLQTTTARHRVYQ